MEELYINRVKLLLLAFLIFTLSSFIGAAATYTVAADGTGNYATIQAAVSNVAKGDVVVVQPGTYTENVNINKTDLANFVLMSASGNPADTIITARDPTKSVLTVTFRNNVTVKGFTFTGASGGTGSAGVYLYGSRYCTVENNVLTDNVLGVSMGNAVNNIVRNNVISKTSNIGTGRGISADSSSNAVISGNSISNHQYGIYLTNSGSSSISGNTVSDSTAPGNSSAHGILLEKTNSAMVESNTVTSTKNYSIYLKESNNDIVRSNVVSKSDNGINLVDSSGNTISNNAADQANHAIFMNGSDNNNLLDNTVSNSHYGIAMRYSDNNNIKGNNAFNNNLAIGDAGYYFTWTSNGNTISGNKANSNFNGFVVINTAYNNVLENNEANSNSNYGIHIEQAYNNNITSNTVSQNSVRGISVLGANAIGNTISSNNVNGNTGYGIHVENANNNYITGNSVSSNVMGINLYNSNNSHVDSNTVTGNNKKGIQITVSSKDRVSNNTVLNNIEHGIYVSISDNITVFKNTASSSSTGIGFNSSVDNIASSNTMEWNGNGMYLCAKSTNNTIYNNNFYNVVNANCKNAACTWYKEIAAGKSIMGGPYVGGNYWAKPDYTGHSQVTPDSNEDGIADSAYTQENVVDNYPLVDYPDILPVASFSTNVTSGTAPLAVQFTDTSQNTTGWSWDFESNGIADSTDKNPVHTYSTAGTYTATLTASNENGTDPSEPVTISVTAAGTGNETEGLPVASPSANVTSGYIPLTVLFTDLSQNVISRSWDIGNDGTVESTDASFVYEFASRGDYPVKLTVSNEKGTDSEVITINAQRKSSSSGGSSGGGGGAGGSPEPAKNVKVKELSQVFITSGKNVKFEFPKNATSVAYLAFDSKKTVGKTTTIVEMLKNKSTLTPDAPTDEVYNYLNIWVGNGGYGSDEDNLENAVACFRVEKAWIQDKGIDKSSIILNRYNDKKWNELPTTLLSEDDKYLYFTAETPGFSPFAITGEATAKETEIQPETGDSKENTGNTAADVEQQPTSEENTTTPEKESNSTPGFEMIYGVAGLLAVFLHKRK